MYSVEFLVIKWMKKVLIRFRKFFGRGNYKKILVNYKNNIFLKVVSDCLVCYFFKSLCSEFYVEERYVLK